MKQSIPIYTSADWNYRGPLWVMLASLDRHLDCSGRQLVYVLTTADSKLAFQREGLVGYRRLDVHYISIENEFASGLPIYGHTGAMTYARLLLESNELCPWDRILYMDADILVRRDLVPLLEAVHAQTAALAGVRECATRVVSGIGGVFNWRELGLKADRPYINAGILGLRLDLIRRERLFTLAMRYLKKYGRQVVSWDQGAINAVACSDLALWSEKYNFTSSYLQPMQLNRYESFIGRKCCAGTELCVIHFTGSGTAKPWHINSLSPYASEYAEYAVKYHADAFPNKSGRLDRWLGKRVAMWLRGIRARCHVS